MHRRFSGFIRARIVRRKVQKKFIPTIRRQSGRRSLTPIPHRNRPRTHYRTISICDKTMSICKRNGLMMMHNTNQDPNIQIQSQPQTSNIIPISNNIQTPNPQHKLKTIKCFFCNENNYGDQLTLYILKKMAAQLNLNVVFAYSEPDKADIIGIGSIIQRVPRNFSGYLWSTGSLSPLHFTTVPASCKCVAVRGPLTAEKIHRSSIVQYGDGGLLMPFVHITPVVQTYTLGIIPHYVDHSRLASVFRNRPNCLVINIQNSIDHVTQQIKSCKFIISSSLHGCIVSDAFQVPNVHIIVNPNKVVGGEWKFRDYYGAFNIPYPHPIVFKPSYTTE